MHKIINPHIVFVENVSQKCLAGYVFKEFILEIYILEFMTVASYNLAQSVLLYYYVNVFTCMDFLYLHILMAQNYINELQHRC